MALVRWGRGFRLKPSPLLTAALPNRLRPSGPALRGGLLVICIAAGIWVVARGGPNSGGQSALVATSPVPVNADPAAAGHERSAAEWAAQIHEGSHPDKTASNETAADGDKA